MQKWSFIHINDTQPGSPRSFRFKPAWLENEAQAYKQIKSLNPELLLHGGDLTRDGSIHDFELIEAKQRLDKLNIPYHVVPGNMDTGNKHTSTPGPLPNRDDRDNNVTSKQLDNFENIFGKYNWSFIHKNVRFTGFYAAVAGSGLRQEKEFWGFLEALPSQVETQRTAHHVVTMHYPLFLDDIYGDEFDIESRDEYIAWYDCIDKKHRSRILELLKKSQVTDVLSGHIHCRRPAQIVDGIRFYKTPAATFPRNEDKWQDGDTALGFTQFNVTDDLLGAKFIPLESVSTRTDGYGPGGHPSKSERDYSLAWEK